MAELGVVVDRSPLRPRKPPGRKPEGPEAPGDLGLREGPLQPASRDLIHRGVPQGLVNVPVARRPDRPQESPARPAGGLEEVLEGARGLRALRREGACGRELSEHGDPVEEEVGGQRRGRKASFPEHFLEEEDALALEEPAHVRVGRRVQPILRRLEDRRPPPPVRQGVLPVLQGPRWTEGENPDHRILHVVRQDSRRGEGVPQALRCLQELHVAPRVAQKVGRTAAWGVVRKRDPRQGRPKHRIHLASRVLPLSQIMGGQYASLGARLECPRQVQRGDPVLVADRLQWLFDRPGSKSVLRQEAAEGAAARLDTEGSSPLCQHEPLRGWWAGGPCSSGGGCGRARR